MVVIAESLWKRRFASNSNVIGKTVTLDGEAHTIIDVMPSCFRFPPASAIPPEMWVPLKFTVDQESKRGSHWMWIVGRLKPGVSIEAARVDMNSIAAQIAKLYPKEQGGRKVLVRPAHKTVRRTFDPLY